jgi:hypothetical protein
MARQNVPLLSWNRGIISPRGLARVDLDRTRLSAEMLQNWLPSTLGPMSIRPGTQYFGSSLNDTGAEFIEFVAATEDVALLEVTSGAMRVRLGEAAHALELLSRPPVDTMVSLSDTGWSNASTGGAIATTAVDLIPVMTGATTNGVTITASSQDPGNVGFGGAAWQAADDNTTTAWIDTGASKGGDLPSWINVDFGADTGNRKAVRSYSIRAPIFADALDNVPSAWRLIASNFDTGTYAIDTGKWALTDERSAQVGWAVSERRTFERLDADTGTVEPRRHWRLYITAITGGGDASGEVFLPEIELFDATVAQQVRLQGGARILNASAIGSRAVARKRVIVSDTGTEHSLVINIGRGPVALRVGSTAGDDDYIRESVLGTGHHSLAFTPEGNFWITFQSDAIVDRIVSSLSIGDSGPVVLTAPWAHDDLDNIRYDQSADVVYIDCDGVRSSKVERRGTGRSWSVVNYEPNDGPFLPAPSSSAKLRPSSIAGGNITITSDIPFFRPTHVGALFRIFHTGQRWFGRLGQADAVTDPVQVTGISDTGTPENNAERRIVFEVSGTYSGSVAIERSIDGEATGFKPVPNRSFFSGNDTGLVTDAIDTGTFTATIDDPDDNLRVWYRARVVSWASGTAAVHIRYAGGGKTGIARITGYNSNMSVEAETLSRFSDTGFSDNWQEGYWSDARGHPTAVALHGGRLGHAQGGSLFLSVSDDYESFNEDVEGDAGPIIRTLGSGPVDRIRYLVSLLRLLIGTSGAELTARASSLDEPLTPSNSSVAAVSTQGSANIRALKMDTRALMVQRSGVRVYVVGPAQNTIADYEVFDLTLLVPDLLKAGVRSVAVQRQPDTRLHCVLGDGTVAILTYEPNEEVICWFTWVTGNPDPESRTGWVERAMVLPGLSEDAVYYHIRRTINGTTRRYLEKWAMEAECQGDTGLSWLADCAVAYTDTGRTATIPGLSHLAGEDVIVWADDTGAASANPHWPDAGKDLSPDVDGVQTTYTVDTGAGNITLGESVHHAVVGLPYRARWRSSKLAYAAEMGTALAQQKRAPQLALSLYRTHNAAIRFGSDTGRLDPLPRNIAGAAVDADAIFDTLDKVAVPMPSTWHPDTRLVIEARAPRPATVLAAIPTVVTHER